MSGFMSTLINFNINLSCLILKFVFVSFWEFCIGKGITSLCWRPDGKAIAVGLEDGTVSLHDVEVRSV